MQFGIHHGAVKIYSLGTVLFFVNDIFVLKVSECIEYNDGCCGKLTPRGTRCHPHSLAALWYSEREKGGEQWQHGCEHSRARKHLLLLAAGYEFTIDLRPPHPARCMTKICGI